MRTGCRIQWQGTESSESGERKSLFPRTRTLRASRFLCPRESGTSAAVAAATAAEARLFLLSAKLTAGRSCTMLARRDAPAEDGGPCAIFFFAGLASSISMPSLLAAMTSLAEKGPTERWVPTCLFSRTIFPMMELHVLKPELSFQSETAISFYVLPEHRKRLFSEPTPSLTFLWYQKGTTDIVTTLEIHGQSR
jgi:hypothetical protein